MIIIPPPNFVVSADAVVTRNSAGDISLNLAASKGPDTFSAPLLDGQLIRTGMGEDLQEQFGGSGIAGSAQVQVYRPDLIPAMSTAQQLSPRTSFMTKGIKFTGFKVHYQVSGVDLTTLNVRIDKLVGVNNVANAITAVLADGANGLAKVQRANPYVTQVNLGAAAQIYQISDMSQMWIEFTVTTPGGSTFRLYGVELLTEFNYN